MFFLIPAELLSQLTALWVEAHGAVSLPMNNKHRFLHVGIALNNRGGLFMSFSHYLFTDHMAKPH